MMNIDYYKIKSIWFILITLLLILWCIQFNSSNDVEIKWKNINERPIRNWQFWSWERIWWKMNQWYLWTWLNLSGDRIKWEKQLNWKFLSWTNLEYNREKE